jgi:hypothetical protein
MTKQQWQMTKQGGAMDFVTGIRSAITEQLCFFAPLIPANKGSN